MSDIFQPTTAEPDHSASPADQESSTANAVWETIKDEMRGAIGDEEYAVWLKPLQSAHIKDDVLTIDIPDMVFYQGFTNNHLHTLEQCKNSLGFNDLHLKLNIAVQDETQNKDSEHHRKNNTKQGQAFSRSLSEQSSLNVAYTFDNFVRGPSNQFALASCLNVSENPGLNYNPLFIYGHTGLGKTHLLNAVGNKVRNSQQDAVVTYISSERFMNEMIYCLRFNKMWDFRQKYRHCDVFLVDDIQFISGKKATQEEFFHTFNSLYETKKQIVLTSDQYPQDIPDIEDRLRNRFRWGLIADIQTPDAEHRTAILFNKAEQLGITLEREVAEYIATHASRNVRELEGALHRIAAFSALQGQPMDINTTKDIFRNVFDEPQTEVSVETIMKAVAEHFKLRTTDLKSKKRSRAFSQPRQIAMYLARTIGNASFPEIGAKFGGKDHTTVIYACRKVESSRGEDLDLQTHLETLERQLENRA